MTAQTIYKELQKAKKCSDHLLLARLFTLVFNRRVQQKEWGQLRKLIRIYGADVVFWSILSSSNITGGNVFAYINKVCSGNVAAATTHIPQHGIAETQKLLDEIRAYEQPDWSSIL